MVDPELKKLLADVNNTQTRYSYEKTICDFFEEVVASMPTHIAIRSGIGDVSYAALNTRINQVAWYLKKNGVKQNTIVAIMMKRSYEMIIGILAILKAGGAYLPIDPSYPQGCKLQIIKTGGVNFLLTDNVLKDFYNVSITNIYLQDPSIGLENIDNPPKINSPHDLAYVIYTSGSTGIPKGVQIEHHSLINRLEWMQKIFPISNFDCLFQKTTYTFDVSVWELLWWAMIGAAVCLLPHGKEYDVKLFTRLIKQNQVSVIHFVPSVLKIFIEYIETEFALEKLDSLKYVFSSGEALDSITVNRFNTIFKNKKFPILINLYGPTEATIDVSYFICDKNKYYYQIPIGKPINNTRFFILNDDLEIVPIETTGELYISGAGLARGYLNDPKQTSEKFISNPYVLNTLMYKTGDLAKWGKDGNVIFLGRQDDQIKLHGLRIEIGEIENNLLLCKGVDNAAVLSVRDGEIEQSLIAFIVGKKEKLVEKEIMRCLTDKLPYYMIPSKLFFLDFFPLKKNGKIDKEKLRSFILK